MNLLKWLFSRKPEKKELTVVGSPMRKITNYESPHRELERIRKNNDAVSLDNQISQAFIASELFGSSYDNSHDSNSHVSESISFDSGFGGGDYSGGGSSGDWSDSGSYSDNSSSND